MSTDVKMLIPCECPCCGENIVIKLDMVPPVVTGVDKLEDADPEVKELIKNENETDSVTEEPEAA